MAIASAAVAAAAGTGSTAPASASRAHARISSGSPRSDACAASFEVEPTAARASAATSAVRSRCRAPSWSPSRRSIIAQAAISSSRAGASSGRGEQLEQHAARVGEPAGTRQCARQRPEQRALLRPTRERAGDREPVDRRLRHARGDLRGRLGEHCDGRGVAGRGGLLDVMGERDRSGAIALQPGRRPSVPGEPPTGGRIW